MLQVIYDVLAGLQLFFNLLGILMMVLKVIDYWRFLCTSLFLTDFYQLFRPPIGEIPLLLLCITFTSK